MTRIQSTIKSIFSMPVATPQAQSACNAFGNVQPVQALDTFNGKVLFGSNSQRVQADTHTLGRLDTFI